ncbi:Apolipoprotein N-acyltransferase [Delftia tsuruhatensis]|uniref:apolipoprotein N-acyltransferase n=1 Tax=Delftia tsuruhatensis TaxID=180282 RepID=UPI001E6ADB83|nr:apolipoprotein N-acyltransferase [Delftia tsuruhatensis]CAB5691834.1 Apolipoprotein N-acyltransferase [Delftia tsuruhatensis]CAC9676834.1 Apolipoprotein N-acyltransferase [Delftia tsuruhatensis]
MNVANVHHIQGWRTGAGLWAAALCAGLSLSLPWLAAALLPVAGALLVHAMGRARNLRSRLLWLASFGTGFLTGALGWLGLGLYRPPVNQLLSSALLWLGIVGLQLAIHLLCFASLYLLLRCLRLRWARPLRGTAGESLLLATAWTLAEALRSTGPLALPWGLWGYGAIDNLLLRGFYPLGGSLLVGWLQWLLAGLLLCGWRALRAWRQGRRPWGAGRRLLLAALLWAGAGTAAQHAEWTREQGPTLRVRVVHTHWPEAQKYQPENQLLALSALEQAADSPQADLVVFPELFLVQRIGLLPAALRQHMALRLREHGAALLFGAPGNAFAPGDVQSDAGQLNTLVLVDEQGSGHSYAKRLLLPFTEYLPGSAWVRWIWPLLYRYPLADMVAGPERQPALMVRGVQLGPLICSELAAPLLSAAQGAQAGLLVVPSSDSWIPSRLYLAQAHALARVRAAELQKPLVRANNAGISSFIDHHGHTLASWGGEAGTGVWTLAPRTGSTPYAAMAAGLQGSLRAPAP